LMMSLWDALRMNMMISYQELVRTFPNIILIKETVYDGCFFDLSSIVIMPIFELITFGVEAVLKRNKTPPKQSCYCWIPIYYTNDLAVMVPVIAEGDTPQKAMKGGDAIIINPFNGEVSHTF
ncbi:hypothetical protein OGY18_13120, partial [Citrobacter sp. Cpo142]|nr:hypothetical protein [Citrobacter sp. Cpo142]